MYSYLYLNVSKHQNHKTNLLLTSNKQTKYIKTSVKTIVRASGRKNLYEYHGEINKAFKLALSKIEMSREQNDEAMKTYAIHKPDLI